MYETLYTNTHTHTHTHNAVYIQHYMKHIYFISALAFKLFFTKIKKL